MRTMKDNDAVVASVPSWQSRGPTPTPPDSETGEHVTAPPPLLRAAQLANRLGVPIGTIYSWASKGLIPCIKMPGVGRLYDEHEVRSWIKRWVVSPHQLQETSK